MIFNVNVFFNLAKYDQLYDLNSIQNSCELNCKTEECMFSKQWLSIHSLKAQHLDIFDVFSNVSFKYCNGVVNKFKHYDGVLDSTSSNLTNFPTFRIEKNQPLGTVKYTF